MKTDNNGIGIRKEVHCFASRRFANVEPTFPLCYEQSYRSMEKIREFRRLMQSRYLVEKQRGILAVGAMLTGATAALTLLYAGCGGSSNSLPTPTPSVPSAQPLQIAD